MESKFISKRRCQGKNHTSIHNIMQLPSPPPAECSIHDSDIENKNCVFWEQSREVVNDCSELGMSFVELAKIG